MVTSSVLSVPLTFKQTYAYTMMYIDYFKKIFLPLNVL